ncbi:hypothetical protein [Flavobacterium sp.]|uniref:hypothetical protein n=1 Tax=Flavobacterium sp. TaxID=239 RepID=UPI001B7C930D|nr:hypothetical protein [Flavobacterium sp.]MBP6128161.1 hypothetical protein [Flavobacterium sp.]
MSSILLICKDLYPLQHPRSFRATELVNEIHSRGHQLQVVCCMSTLDFNEYKKQYPNVSILNLGDVSSILNHSFFQKNKFLYRVFDKVLYYFLLYPYIKLMFRVRHFLINNKEKHDLLITIAHPYSIHWGAAFARNRKNGLFPSKWIADCGDPFMGNKIAPPPFYFSVLEKLFCKKADKIAIPVEVARKAYYKEFHQKIEIIPQGFNFSNIQLEKYVKNTIPTFIYAGVFYKGKRDPRPFLDYLSKLDKDFRFIIYTSNDSLLSDYKIKLQGKLIIKNFIPRSEILKELSKADFLLNIENETSNQVPSKLIDYSLSNRPTLSLKMNELDLEIFSEFLNGDYSKELVISNINDYNINNVVDQFLEIIYN